MSRTGTVVEKTPCRGSWFEELAGWLGILGSENARRPRPPFCPGQGGQAKATAGPTRAPCGSRSPGHGRRTRPPGPGQGFCWKANPPGAGRWKASSPESGLPSCSGQRAAHRVRPENSVRPSQVLMGLLFMGASCDPSKADFGRVSTSGKATYPLLPRRWVTVYRA